MRLDIKTTIIALLLIVIILLTTCNSCQQKAYEKKIAKLEGGYKSKSDTVYQKTTDTFKLDNPIAYKVEVPKLVTHLKFDTIYIEGIDTVFVDTLVGRHYATNFYKNTFKTKYGDITAFDTVTRNKLTGQSIVENLNIPIVTNTVTKVEQRGILYFGIDAYGNKKELLNGAGVSLMYKTPRTLSYEIGVMWNSQNQINYRVGLKFPLTLKLKK